MNFSKTAFAGIVILLGLGVGTNRLHAQAPNFLNYQGKLTTTAGTAASGAFSITFSIYSTATGGTAIWTETQNVNIAPGANGTFNVLLGSVTPLASTLFTSGGDRYLGIKVGTDPEMTPRFRLTSVAFAIRANEADGVADGSINSIDINDGTIQAADLTNGAVTSAKIASSQVVKSINSLKDDVTIAAGTNVTITPSGNTLTIAATGGSGGGTITGVTAGSGLTGGGTSGNVTLSIVNLGVGTAQLADNAVNSAKIQDGTVTNADVSATAPIAGTKIIPDFGAQRILTIGDAGIGTTTPQAKLDVNGSAIIRDSIELMTTGANPFIDFSNNATDFDARIILAGDDKLAIEGTNVGIGTAIFVHKEISSEMETFTLVAIIVVDFG